MIECENFLKIYSRLLLKSEYFPIADRRLNRQSMICMTRGDEKGNEKENKPCLHACKFNGYIAAKVGIAAKSLV